MQIERSRQEIISLFECVVGSYGATIEKGRPGTLPDLAPGENRMYQACVGLDVHKKVIAYCIKTADGAILYEGSIKARRFDIDQ